MILNADETFSKAFVNTVQHIRCFTSEKKGSQVATLLPSDAFSKSKQMAKASTLAQIFATTTGQSRRRILINPMLFSSSFLLGCQRSLIASSAPPSLSGYGQVPTAAKGAFSPQSPCHVILLVLLRNSILNKENDYCRRRLRH